MAKGRKPRISIYQDVAVTRPIQHGENDNTELLEQRQLSIQSSKSKLQPPKNMPFGKNYNNKAASDSGAAYNGGTVTAP